jgi:hypothetical protein
MDAAEAGKIQEDEQQEASLEAAIQAAIDARMKEVHTCLPGIVQKFNEKTQTATVQPAIQCIYIDKGPVNLPLCVDVPVHFPAGGNFVLTFPVKVKDECLLVFSERAIDFWFDRGGVQLPAEYRMHDLSDAFAFVGFSSKGRPDPITSFNTSAAELRTRDGSVVLRIENDKIVLDAVSVFVGGTAGAQPAIKGAAYNSAMSTLLTALSTYAAAIQGTADPSHAATPALLSAITAFNTAAGAALAAKAKVL